jgi:hypothetical protein
MNASIVWLTAARAIAASGARVGQPRDVVPGLLAERLQQRPQVLRAAARGHRVGVHAGPCLEVALLQAGGAGVCQIPEAGELGRQGEQRFTQPHADGLEVLYFPGPVQALACHVQAASYLEHPGVLAGGRCGWLAIIRLIRPMWKDKAMSMLLIWSWLYRFTGLVITHQRPSLV